MNNPLLTTTTLVFEGIVEDYKLKINLTEVAGEIAVTSIDKFDLTISFNYHVTSNETLENTVEIVLGIAKQLASVHHLATKESIKYVN